MYSFQHFGRCLRHLSRSYSSSRAPGFIIDIDGVLTRGSKVLQCALNALRKLTDNNKFIYPVTFLTNGSSASENDKALQLSKLTGINISGEQVILVNTPLKQFVKWHDKSIFFAGQPLGLQAMAKNLGFKKPVFLEDFHNDLPMFDVIDHRKRTNLKSGILPLTLPSYIPIEGIMIANTPVNWEAHTQLILDLLLTEGSLRDLSPGSTQIPLIACNPDLVWAAEYHLPRIACGAYVHMLTCIYREFSGRELEVIWCGKPTRLTYDYAKDILAQQAAQLNVSLGRIYGIGDNIDVDVVGANSNDLTSVLVSTGLYHNDEVELEFDVDVPSKRASTDQLIRAKIVCRDIEVCVDYVLGRS